MPGAVIVSSFILIYSIELNFVCSTASNQTANLYVYLVVQLVVANSNEWRRTYCSFPCIRKMFLLG